MNFHPYSEKIKNKKEKEKMKREKRKATSLLKIYYFFLSPRGYL
jgi:hypothetical protein